MMKIILILALGLFSCTAQQVATAQADFKLACQDWQGVKALAAPFATVPVVAVTEGFVSDVCDNQAFISTVTAESVTWLQISTQNLQKALTQVAK